MKNTSNATYFSKATTSLEVYARQEDQYIPLLKLDSIFQWRGMLVADIREYLALPFENCFEKLTSIDLNKRLQHGKKITVTELNNYNNKLRKFPRFETNLMERGIYLTFQDFLNNKLHKKDFNVEFGDLTDELYVIENGTQTVFEKFWGFCDGQKTYFKIGYNFSLLTPALNTYELWGAKSITQRFVQYRPTGGGGPAQMGLEGALGSAIFNTKKATIINLPLQLNMETGEVY